MVKSQLVNAEGMMELDNHHYKGKSSELTVKKLGRPHLHAAFSSHYLRQAVLCLLPWTARGGRHTPLL